MACALAFLSSAALRSFAARSDTPPTYPPGSARISSIAPPKLRLARYLSSTQISRPPSVRSFTHRPGPAPGGARLVFPNDPRLGRRKPLPPMPPVPGLMIPNTRPSAYTTPRVTAHPANEDIHGGGP